MLSSDLIIRYFNKSDPNMQSSRQIYLNKNNPDMR